MFKKIKSLIRIISILIFFLSFFNLDVKAQFPTIENTSIGVCVGNSPANLRFSGGLTGVTYQYSLDFNTTAKAQGFVDVGNTTMLSSPIAISVPGSAVAGSYNANLTIRNLTTSATTVIAVTIQLSTPPTTPIASIIGGLSATACVNVGVPLTSNSSTGNQWYKNGVLIVGATNQIFNAFESATYSVVVTNNSCNSATSNGIAVTINPLQIATISYPESAFCATGSTTVTQTGVTGGTYSSSSGLSINSSTGAINLSASTSGTYTVNYVVSGSGCLSTASTTVTIRALPVIPAIAGVSNINPGVTSTLTNITPGGSWVSTNPAVATINPTSGLITGVSVGTTSIIYTVISGGCLNTASKSITVSNNNFPPVTVEDSYSVIRGGTITQVAPGVLLNDTDAENNTLSAIRVLSPVVGTLVLNSNGSFTYTHNGGASNFDSFTYKTNDGTNDGNIVTVSISITGSNVPPVIQNDTYNVASNATTVIAAPGVLGNDTDLQNDPLTAIIVTNPVHGKLTLSSNGSFVYVHNGIGSATSDSFTYKANDGKDDSNFNATVTLNIVRPNQAPLAVSDSYNLTRGSTINVSVPGLLSNDSDSDGNTLTAIKVSNPVNGTLTLNSNGSFTYVHGGGKDVSDSFTYKVNDGKVDGNTVTVILNIAPAVGNPPVIADISKIIFKNQTYTFSQTDFKERFVDLLLDLQKVRVVTLPANGILKLAGVNVIAGQEIISIDLANLTFTPILDFVGTMNFEYNAASVIGYALVNKNVNFKVLDPGKPPVAIKDTYTTTLGGTLTVASPGVLANDSDDEGHAITAIKVSDPLHGSLILNANGSFTYTHNGSKDTTDNFTYRAFDGTNNSEVTTVKISIPFVNNPPVISDINLTMYSSVPLLLRKLLFANKFLDADTLTKVKFVSLPTNGVLKINGIPAVVGQEFSDFPSVVDYEPPLNWAGTVSFFWNAHDGTQYAKNNARIIIKVDQPIDPTVKIGLAKQLAFKKANLNGTYDLKFIFSVMNYGINDLNKVSVKDNLALAFIGTEFKVKALHATGNLRVNNAFTGIGDTELLLNSSKLTGGEEAKIELEINVKLSLSAGLFANSATAEGESQINGFKVSDISTNGLKPDPNLTGDVSPEEVTTIQLDVLPPYVPPGFSPNGDGVNDKFVVQNAMGKLVSLEMYNRWGNRIYRSNDYKNDWGGEATEGLSLGQDIPDGTYYYIIVIDNKDKHVGFITVNR